MLILRVILIPFIVMSAAGAAIVNNSTTLPTAEDSLHVVFYSLDSLGNPTGADSVFLMVSGPDGGIAFRDSMLTSDSRVRATTISGKQFYSFAEQVSNLDSSGIAGNYVLTLLAKQNATGLLTPNTYSFQIISTELSDRLALIGDSVLVKGGAVDSNRTEQGTALDSGLVARWVWNTPQTNHTASGTFGKYLDTEVSGVSSGAGSYSFTIVAFDSTVSQTIPYAFVTVRNVGQTALMASGGTGSSGTVSFNLDADSFMVTATAPGYQFSVYDTLVVTGAGTDTIFGDQFDPGAPVSGSLCRVYGWLYDITGQPEAGAEVAAALPSGVVRHLQVIVSPFHVSTTTDSTGYFYLDLIPSASLVPVGTMYEATISRSDGTVLRQRIAVPDSTSWRLTW